MSLFSFSKKTDYGFLFLNALKQNEEDNEKISISTFATENKLSVKFMEKIAKGLKNAGIVKSIEGRSGGYMLAKSSKDITLYEILTALEGEIAHTECMKEGSKCAYEQICGMKFFWKDLGSEMENILKTKTLDNFN